MAKWLQDWHLTETSDFMVIDGEIATLTSKLVEQNEVVIFQF